MPLNVSKEQMTSGHTVHTAKAVGGDAWIVSWLPNVRLDSDQALSAMTLAEYVAAYWTCGAEVAHLSPDEFRSHMRHFSHVVGLDEHDAFDRASKSPQ